MSSKNQSTESGKKLAQLMAALGLTQKQDLARLLDVSPTAILHWENGRSRPSAETYIRLAKLAQEKSPSLGRWFWQQAGVDEATLRTLIPEIDQSFKNVEKRLRDWSEKEPEGFVPLPLVEDIGQGSHDDVISRIRSAIRDGVEIYVPFPRAAISAPQSTVCLRAPDDYMRPVFHLSDLLAVDISCEGKPSPEAAYEFAKKITQRAFTPLGDRAFFAAYYDRPEKPPRWHGRRGLHARAITLMLDAQGKSTGHIHLTTEMGLNIAAAMQALGGGKPRFSDEEIEEVSDIIIPVDTGVSILGKVVAWFGSAWDSQREPSQEYRAIDTLGTIGGYLNKFAAGLAHRKPPRGPKK